MPLGLFNSPTSVSASVERREYRPRGRDKGLLHLMTLPEAEGQRSRWRTQPVWSWSGDVIRNPLTRGQREECGAGVGAAGKACELGLFGKAT